MQDQKLIELQTRLKVAIEEYVRAATEVDERIRGLRDQLRKRVASELDPKARV